MNLNLVLRSKFIRVVLTFV